METNEIMVNDKEVIEEVTEEIATKKSGSRLGVAAIVGVGVLLVGGLAAKYIVLPAVAKHKKKKEQDSEIVDTEYTEIDDEETTNESEETEK